MRIIFSKLAVFLLIIPMVLVSCSSDEQLESGDDEIGVLKFYFENGRYFDVLIEADTLSAEALDDPELRFMIAQTYLRIGHPEHAQEILENLKVEGKMLDEIPLLLVEALYKQKKLDQAKKMVVSKEMLDANKDDPRRLLLNAQIELASNNIEVAKTLLNKLTEVEQEEFNRDRAKGNIWLARIDLLENRKSRAIARIESVLAEDDTLDEAWLLLGNIKFQDKEYSDAENYYLQALKLDNSRILTQQSLQVAQNVLRSKTALGRVESGRQFYQRFLDSYPKSPIYYFELARLAYSNNDLEDAEKNLKEVLKSSPNNPRVIVLLSKILIQQDKLSETSEFLQAHVDGAVGGVNIIALKTFADMGQGNNQQAIDLLTKYSRSNDSYHIALAPLLAYAHLKNNDKDKQIEVLNAYDIRDPNSIRSINSIRTILLEIEENEEAELFLTQLIEAHPESDEVKVLYLSTLNAIGKNEDVSEKIEQWLSEQSNNTTLKLVSIGQAVDSGNYASAIKQFKKINPGDLADRDNNLLVNNIKNLIFKTRGEANQRDVFQLLKEWQIALPENVSLKLMLADIYITEGVYKQAAPLYESILAKHPNDYVVLNNLAWSYHQLGDSRAIETAERAYASNPNDAPVCDTFGWIMVENGKIKQGLELLERAVEIDPSNKDIREHLELAKARLL